VLTPTHVSTGGVDAIVHQVGTLVDGDRPKLMQQQRCWTPPCHDLACIMCAHALDCVRPHTSRQASMRAFSRGRVQLRGGKGCAHR
jgi:hypothetical protein